MHSPYFLIFIAGILLLLDTYLLQGLRAALADKPVIRKKYFTLFYWIFCVGMLTGLLLCVYVKLGVGIRAAFMMAFFVTQIAKLCFLPFMLIDDLRRLTVRLSRNTENKTVTAANTSEQAGPLPISRSAFLMKAGIMATAVPIVSMGVGAITRMGCFDYHIKRVDLYLPNLPKKFNGLRLGQVSDIHSGSYHQNDRVRIKGGVDMLASEKPDLIFFTGDLVNDLATDIKWVYDLFVQIKAPLGVFSILGNHDYGDYSHLTGAPRQKNRDDILRIHKNYGWQLLLNENRRLKVEGEEIGIIGIENWGMLSRFPKYGRMDLATRNTDDLPVKLLLSHDPSHWRAEVVAKYPQVDMAFAGHTHGMQFGVQTGAFQWSPVEYLYQEWAGLYCQGHQQLYVNVGYGYIGYPGRVGILPEITIFTLRSAAGPLHQTT